MENENHSPEFIAINLKLAGERLAAEAEVLRLGALGQLTEKVNLFGETETPEEQLAIANLGIERAIESINKFYKQQG